MKSLLQTKGFKKRRELKNGGIYSITCTANGRVYIGATMDFRLRWGRHRHELRKGIHHALELQNSFFIYGEESLVYAIVERIDHSDELRCAEQKWIHFFETNTAEKGFNTTKAERLRLPLPTDTESSELMNLSSRNLKQVARMLRVHNYSYKTKHELVSGILSKSGTKDIDAIVDQVLKDSIDEASTAEKTKKPQKVKSVTAKRERTEDQKKAEVEREARKQQGKESALKNIFGSNITSIDKRSH